MMNFSTIETISEPVIKEATEQDLEDLRNFWNEMPVSRLKDSVVAPRDVKFDHESQSSNIFDAPFFQDSRKVY